MDTALYDIASKKNRMPLSKFLSSTSCNNVKFSSLYSNQSHRKQYGTNTIKYKLGTNSLNQDIEILESISNHNKSIKFRLDANRNYTLGEFVNIYKKLEKFNVDYFEEPIKNLNIEKLKKIKNEFNIKIAIDESLYDGSDYKTWLKTDLINSIIIKPNSFGGYKKMFDLCRIGQNNNVKIIFSSSLESSIGNMASIHLAATLEDNQEHGLDIHNFYNTFFVFIIVGIWHGPSWLFVIHGGWHGVGLIINHSFKKLFQFEINKYVGWFLTFNYVNVSLIFLRSDTLDNSISIIKGMSGLNGFSFPIFFEDKIYIILILLISILISFTFKNTKYLLENFRLKNK